MHSKLRTLLQVICIAVAALIPGSGYTKGFTVPYYFKGDIDAPTPQAPVIVDSSGNVYGTASSSVENGIVYKIAPDGTKTNLHVFRGGDDGDGFVSGLLTDALGNFYGTTSGGGSSGCDCGVVFKLAADGTETVLYRFQDVADAYGPMGGVIMDSAGNLFGTTYGGGAPGYGTVFKLTPSGIKTTLHTFAGSRSGDGAYPSTPLIFDAAGNLYGTTLAGGINGCYNFAGCGVVFKLAPDGTETILYAFKDDGQDGQYPYGGLAIDDTGNLYGSTSQGGTGHCVAAGTCGTVYRVSPDGAETVLYSFRDDEDGADPEGSLIWGATVCGVKRSAMGFCL